MTQTTTGRFITVEGSEGVGKSTNLEFIAEFLSSRGLQVLQTREPGGTEIAERIREVLLQSAVGSMTDRCELLLMFAARDDHLAQVIRPALARGEWVLCDRFIDATYAYQGGGRGMNPAEIGILENLVLDGMLPDLTILLDTTPEIAAQRRTQRGVEDRFEAEQAEFFARVRTHYAQRAKLAPERIHYVDASGDLADVQDRLESLLNNYINNIS